MQIIIAIIGAIVVGLLFDVIFDFFIEIVRAVAGPLLGIIGLLFIFSAYDTFRRRNSWIYKLGIYKFSYCGILKLLAIGTVLIGIFIIGLGGLIVDVVIAGIGLFIFILVFWLVWISLVNESIFKRLVISIGVTVVLVALSPILTFIPFLNFEGSVVSNVGRSVGRVESKIISNTKRFFTSNEKKAFTIVEKNTARSIEKTAEQIEKEGIKKGLSKETRSSIMSTMGWSSKMVDAIGSELEYNIYKRAKLRERLVNGKECLVTKINWNQIDQYGRTNRERGKLGLAPLDDKGNPFELHHIGQKDDSPLAELTMIEHRGKENDSILHDKSKETEIDRAKFANERIKHWITRATEDE